MSFDKSIDTLHIRPTALMHAPSEEHNFTPPLRHRAMFTNRLACDVMKAKDIGAWLKAVFPLSKKPILPPPQWSCGTPAFLPLLIEVDALSEYERNEQGLAVMSGWQNAILNDTFLNFMAEDDGEAMWALVEAFLKAFREVPKQRIPTWFCNVYKDVGRTLLGFAGLISPRPDALGSTPKDVDWLLDRATVEQTETIGNSLIKINKSIKKRLEKDDIWKQAVSDYDETAGAYTTHGRDLLNLELQAQELLERWLKPDCTTVDEDLPQLMQIMHSVVKDLTLWRQDLRSGATSYLEELCLQLSKVVIKASREVLEGKPEVTDRTAALDRLRKMSEALPMLNGKGTGLAAQLQQDARAMLAAWSEKDKIAVLLQAVRAQDASVSNVCARLSEAQNLTKPKELLDGLLSFLPKVYDTMCLIIQGTDLSTGALDSHIQYLDLLKKQQDFLDVAGGKAKIHKQVKTITDCAKSVLNILVALAQAP